MELVSYAIKRKRADHTPIVVAPIGDLQWAGRRGPTALDTLKRHIDRCLKLNAYFIGMGDYTDFLSPSNRQRLRGAALYDTALDAIDDAALDLVQEIFHLALRPTKGRWLGMLEGHHFAALETGETTDQRLCQLLNARHLGTVAYVRLQFDIGGTRSNVTLWAHHGVGGGQSRGAALNKLASIASGWEGADIFLMGHTNKVSHDKFPRPYPRWHGREAPDLVHRDIHLVNTGGFNKSYIVGATQGRVPRDGYAAKGAMNPVSLCAPIIHITPRIGSKRTKAKGLQTAWEPEIRVEV